ncbi:MAG: agmatine deiminase family protein [Pseudomonadota bacterium]
MIKRSSVLDFMMPAEWEPHERCWMAWPCRPATWTGRVEGRIGGIGAARQAYAAVAHAISEFEPVTMICQPQDVASAKAACGPAVDVLPIDISDSWSRDTGPTFVRKGEGGLAMIDWQFNSWGDDRPGYEADKVLPAALAKQLGLDRVEADFVFEGGAVHVDGEGTALVVEECVLHSNRNPGMTKSGFESRMRQYLGIEKVIWLPRGLIDDETDGHVDEVACFAGPGHVLAMVTSDQDDANFERLRDNLCALNAATDSKGRSLRVTQVPQPSGHHYTNGERVSLSYVNFYLANEGLVMPAFGVPEDDAAFAILQSVFPAHRVVQVPAFAIALGGGCIHCITQQQPIA